MGEQASESFLSYDDGDDDDESGCACMKVFFFDYQILELYALCVFNPLKIATNFFFATF